MIPPEAAATIGATIGRSQAAVIVERGLSWKYILEVNRQLKDLGGKMRKIMWVKHTLQKGGRDR